MTFFSRSLLVFASVLLIHACYSAQEFSSLAPSQKKLSTPADGSPFAASIAQPAAVSSSFSQLTSLPLDITIETLVSVALLCVAIVLGSEELKPISWRVWAGDLERRKGEKKRPEDLGKIKEEGYEWLEDGKRKGFIDIRARRKEFAEWVKTGGSANKS